ncbi:MAG: putative baseplate assembly protein [Acidobacteria bacterium]|nr:putative baseplate assembly protein [Acidobacteriota bacterium]
MSGCACGCCAGVHQETPRVTSNRHGLSAIVYRAGDYPSFMRSMLGTIAGTSRLLDDGTSDFPLTRLTRDRDDFSIALLDAWATSADVLTFYQERIANESYLRTAGERLSVVELTRLIGYRLSPGVAAGAWLAFAVDDSEGAPGHVTLDAGTKVQSVPGQNEVPHTFETASLLEARAEWNELTPRRNSVRIPKQGDTSIYFAGTSTNLSVGDGLLFFNDDAHADFRRVASVSPDFDNARTLITWGDGLTSAVTVSGNAKVIVYAFRVHAGLFGHNAPDPRTLSGDTRSAFNNSGDPDSKITTGNEWEFPIAGAKIFVEGEQLAIRPGSLAILRAGTDTQQLFKVTAVSQVTKASRAISGKATQLELSGSAEAFQGEKYRGTVVFAANEELPLGEAPRSDSLAQKIELDRAITPPAIGRAVLISDATGSVVEPATIASVDTTSDPLHTTIGLAAPLVNAFNVATARIFANVTSATHGETFRETLGSGDASTPFQRFALSHAPLTYVHSPSDATGAASTLQLFVNDIVWHERPSLYGAATNERTFETLRNADEKTFVQFGDGKTEGAPVPTGHDNVRAIYRTGIGSAANVAAHTLTILMSRPLGLDGVDNPLPATGGTDPESLSRARENAPGKVRALDRVVSLRDYQDFAATFAGITKAIATWSVAGREYQVFLTVAGTNGATFGPGDATITALRGALIAAGDPFVPLRIASYLPAPFNVAAKVGIETDRVAAVVLQGVRDALAAAFSFDARAFGEAVDLSDLVAVIHSVAGVRSVDVDLLYRSTGSPAREERLGAAKPRQFANGALQAAEILILDTATITEAK